MARASFQVANPLGSPPTVLVKAVISGSQQYFFNHSAGGPPGQQGSGLYQSFGPGLVKVFYPRPPGSQSPACGVVELTVSIAATGHTDSNNFPTTDGAFDRTKALNLDAFAFRLNPLGTELVFSTYLGGNSDDIGYAVAVDSGGRVTVAGRTGQSGVFPTTPGAFKEVGGPPLLLANDGFVTKLAPDGGSLVYSTLLGGASDDLLWDLCSLPDGRVVAVGGTVSTDYPVTSGAYVQPGSDYDIFVSILGQDGASLPASSVFGGSSFETAYAVDADSLGRVFVAGEAGSADFPTTPGSYQEQIGGFSDAFVLRLAPDLTDLEYCTYVGDAGSDSAWSLRVDPSGIATLAGVTVSGQFPTTAGALIPNQFQWDGMTFRLSPQGDRLFYSTILGVR